MLDEKKSPLIAQKKLLLTSTTAKHVIVVDFRCLRHGIKVALICKKGLKLTGWGVIRTQIRLEIKVSLALCRVQTKQNEKDQ